MQNVERRNIASGLAGVAAGLNPLTSITFLVAMVVTAAAGWIWFKNSGEVRQPFPLYGIVAGCYAGGFLIGRVLRSFLKIAAIVAALVLGGLGVLHWANVDTSKAREAVKDSSAWLEEKSDRAKDYLMHFLPSGAAAGAGVFAGGRRRRTPPQ